MKCVCLTITILLATVLGFVIGMRFVLNDVRRRSWGKDWGGHCFEVLETETPGCAESYASKVTLRVH